jgi:hypothetical protein
LCIERRIAVALIQIDSGYFCAGVVVEPRGIVIKAAPILKYMVGWNSKRVHEYCRVKNWSIVVVKA